MIARQGIFIIITNGVVTKRISLLNFSFNVRGNRVVFLDDGKFSIAVDRSVFGDDPKGHILDAIDISGDKGADGMDGAIGAKGDTGEKGDTGDQGDKGDQGIQGEKGDDGEKGDQGESGKDGDQGIVGQDGQKGETGSDGAKGDRGEVGRNGSDGEQGLVGSRGDVGPRGDKGQQGLHWSSTYEDDSYLENEVVAFEGNLFIAIGKVPEGQPPVVDGELNTKYWDLFLIKGKDGANGAKGSNGSDGVQGPQGIQGPQGDAGDPATDIKDVKVSVNDTTPGFLLTKIIAGTDIVVEEVSDGGDERLRIRSTASGGGGSSFADIWSVVTLMDC